MKIIFVLNSDQFIILLSEIFFFTGSTLCLLKQTVAFSVLHRQHLSVSTEAALMHRRQKVKVPSSLFSKYQRGGLSVLAWKKSAGYHHGDSLSDRI